MAFGKQRPSAPWSQGNYWGQYANATSLPNMAGAPLQLESVQAGDLAWSNADGALYLCTDPTRGAAVWVALASGGTINTRDAHEIVVGSAANGDVAGLDADIVDPGDGSGLATALGQAAALGRGVDIRLRSMTLTLNPGVVTLPLSIPANCRLIGLKAGRNIAGGADTGSRIIGPSSGDQRIFVMGGNTQMIDLSVISPAPTAATSGPTGGVISAADQTLFERCNFGLGVAVPTALRTQTDMIQSDSTDLRVVGCRFLGGKQAGQGVGAATRAVHVTDTVGSLAPTLLTRCSISSFDHGFVSDSDRFTVESSLFADIASRCVWSTLDSGNVDGRGAHVRDCDLGTDSILWGPGFEKRGVEYDLVDAAAAIQKGSVKVIGNHFGSPNQLGIGVLLASTGGVDLRGAVVQGNQFEDLDIGVSIPDAEVEYSLVGGNHFANTGTADINDLGVGTEQFHNTTS